MGAALLQLGVFWEPTSEKNEISGSEKCILEDPGDGFAMDDGLKVKTLRPSGLIGGFGNWS